MLEEIIAQYGTKFAIAAIAVLLGLACLALVLWIVRRRPSSPFIRGGRNRQPRLSVLDAAAVDTRRRLVLVRRDDVEHLLMIGGPTDIVIESRILTNASEEPRPEAAAAPAQQAVPAAPVAEVVSTSLPAEMQAPVPARPAPQAPLPAARIEAPVPERRPEPVARPMPPSGVSAMGHVLYGEDDLPPRPAAPQPISIAPEPPVHVPSRAAPPQQTIPLPSPASELNAIDALDRARDRVLTNPVGTGSERIGMSHEVPATMASTPIQPQRPATDNAALVSEFEKILEAEIAATPRPGAGHPGGGRVEPARIESVGDQPKTREETEAEMARLLGELSANRKS